MSQRFAPSQELSDTAARTAEFMVVGKDTPVKRGVPRRTVYTMRVMCLDHTITIGSPLQLRVNKSVYNGSVVGSTRKITIFSADKQTWYLSRLEAAQGEFR